MRRKIKKKNKKKKENKIFLIFLFLIFFLFLCLVLFIFKGKTIEMEMKVRVGNVIGMNADPVLDFGTLLPGMNATKYLFINSTEFRYCEIKVKGNISNFVKVFPKKFKIKNQERVKVLVSIPSDTEKNFFQGKLILYFYNFKILK